MTPSATGLSPARGRVKLRLLVLVALVLGSGVYLVAVRRGKSRARAAASPTAPRAKPPPEPAVFVDLGSFVVNVISEDELRYLKASVTLVAQPKTKSDAEEKGKEGESKEKKGGKQAAGPQLSPADDARAKDAITRVLSDQRFDELRKGAPREAAKQALVQELNEVLEDYTVIAVLYTSFVMQ